MKKTKFCYVCFIFAFTSCICWNKEENFENNEFRSSENYGDFPVTDTYFYFYEDIKSLLNCKCLEVEFADSLSDEQGNLIFIGGATSYLLNSEDSFNLVKLRYDFLIPPNVWFHPKNDMECIKVLVPKITMSKERNLFFGKFHIPSIKKYYCLLMIKNKNFVWKKKITGALFDG